MTVIFQLNFVHLLRFVGVQRFPVGGSSFYAADFPVLSLVYFFFF